MERLTKKQSKLLSLIKGFIRENGYPPTVRELVTLMGNKGTAGVQKLLCALERKGYIRRIHGRSRGIIPVVGGQTSLVPLLGLVVAGVPVISEEQVEGYYALDSTLVPKGSFLLRVQGESMIGDHIQDGDLILVRPQPVAEEGDIVVAMVDGEVTVKRLHFKKEGIELVPSHPDMRPILIRREEALRIIGKVVAVFRFFERGNNSLPKHEGGVC